MSVESLLRSLRAAGENVSVGDLARRLVAAERPPGGEVARRLVAAALGWDPLRMPDPLAPDDLRDPASRAVARIPIEGADFVVVDLETTGLSADSCEIIEIGAVRVRNLRVADEFVTFVRPQRAIPERITRLTGIGDDMVTEAPCLPEAIGRFRGWFDHTPRATFVAHNAGFDSRFLTAALARCGLPPLEVPVLCTRRLGRRLAPEVGRYNLDHLCAHFGHSNAARHRAAGDARVTARLLIDLLARAPDASVRTLGELLDFQQRPPARAKARA